VELGVPQATKNRAQTRMDCFRNLITPQPYRLKPDLRVRNHLRSLTMKLHAFFRMCVNDFRAGRHFSRSVV
jgi:hypothetical protein